MCCRPDGSTETIRPDALSIGNESDMFRASPLRCARRHAAQGVSRVFALARAMDNEIGEPLQTDTKDSVTTTTMVAAEAASAVVTQTYAMTERRVFLTCVVAGTLYGSIIEGDGFSAAVGAGVGTVVGMIAACCSSSLPPPGNTAVAAKKDQP